MLYTGLTSVTFRQLSTDEIIRLAAEAGLDGIEWGGDVHVPPGELDHARSVREKTIQAGLAVSSYGSYYRVGGYGEAYREEWDKIVMTAKALGAPVIRVWAGDKGSGQADESWRETVTGQSRVIADMAAKEKIQVAFEYHGGTLTDTAESAVRMYRDISHPNISAYWQPAVDLSVEGRLDSLKQVTPWLSNIHIFHWVGRDRLPLSEGVEPWGKYLQYIKQLGGSRYIIMEFVRDAQPEQFLADAKTLRQLMESEG